MNYQQHFKLFLERRERRNLRPSVAFFVEKILAFYHPDNHVKLAKAMAQKQAKTRFRYELEIKDKGFHCFIPVIFNYSKEMESGEGQLKHYIDPTKLTLSHIELFVSDKEWDLFRKLETLSNKAFQGYDYAISSFVDLLTELYYSLEAQKGEFIISVVHELTHLIDFVYNPNMIKNSLDINKRTEEGIKERKLKYNKKLDVDKINDFWSKRYISMPAEINTFFVTAISNMPPKAYSDFNSYKKEFIKKMGTFWRTTPQKTKERFLKRLYQYWNENH